MNPNQLPLICNDPGLPTETCNMLQDAWANYHPLVRQQFSLPLSHWKNALGGDCVCYAVIPTQEMVLIPRHSRCFDLCSEETPPELMHFAEKQTFSLIFDTADPKIAFPAVGDTLTVSKSCDSSDVWATLV